MVRKVLQKEFFEKPTLRVARELLGKYLVRRVGGKTIAIAITETEVYDGFDDLASHARRGQTPRNTPMYGEAAVAYVYFTYGMHWMLNIVCGKEKYPAAVLIRGAGGIVGPARLTKALSIDKRLNHQKLGKKLGLWIEDRGLKVTKKDYEATGRIGVDYSGDWAQKPLRFVLTKESRQRLLSHPPRRRDRQIP